MKLRNFIRKMDTASECKVVIHGVGEMPDVQMIEESPLFQENKEKIVDWFYVHMNTDVHPIAEIVIYLKATEENYTAEELSFP